MEGECDYLCLWAALAPVTQIQRFVSPPWLRVQSPPVAHLQIKPNFCLGGELQEMSSRAVRALLGKLLGWGLRRSPQSAPHVLHACPLGPPGRDSWPRPQLTFTVPKSTGLCIPQQQAGQKGAREESRARRAPQLVPTVPRGSVPPPGTLSGVTPRAAVPRPG